MTDQSHLDRQYFIDHGKYNCPFCKRGSVTYKVVDRTFFHWSPHRTVCIYVVQCGNDQCVKRSAHFSNYDFPQWSDHGFGWSPVGVKAEEYNSENLDDYFFHQQPTSSFTANSLIPENLRELIAEAEGARRMGWPVASSGALRKAIYELLKHQEVRGSNYEDRIKALKVKYPEIHPTYFDALANIQGMTSEELHEQTGDWVPWDNKQLVYLVEVTKVVFDEIYVKPAERQAVIDRISSLRNPEKA